MLLIALETVRKMVFVRGESAPIWGRYGGLKFGFLAYSNLLLLGTVSSDFRLVDCVRQLRWSSKDSENFVKFGRLKLEQCALEVGNIAVCNISRCWRL